MWLLAGLGNPRPGDAGNRHNIGFMAVDRIHARRGFPPWRARFRGFAADGLLAGEKVLLLKPLTYMNLSGESVGEAARFFKIPTERVIVFLDELDLDPGRVRVRIGGGTGGHNGIRSIDPAIGLPYRRVRIGIGHPGDKALVHGWVLSDFAKADRPWLETLLDTIADSADLLLQAKDGEFMNRCTLALFPPKPKSPPSTSSAPPSSAPPSPAPPSPAKDVDL